jgi:hypothetical protein
MQVLTRIGFVSLVILTGFIMETRVEMKDDRSIEVTESILESLRQMRSEPKFYPDPAQFYGGAPEESIRREAEGMLNDLLDRLLEGIEANPSKSYVLDEFRRTLGGFDDYESEEQDRICLYLEDIMDILGIESSNGLLNTWRYGFDPTSMM